MSTISEFPEAKFLDASHFEIDLRYQREPEERLGYLKKIAADFRQSEFGVLHVTKRATGKTVIIDGAGRSHVYYNLLGREGKLQCIVHDPMPLAKEAELFVRLNRNRKAVNSGGMFKADVAAKDKEAVAINNIFENLGMTIGRSCGPLNISSVQSAKLVFRIDPALLTRTLAIKKAVWPEDVCGGGLLEGIALFLRAVPALDEIGFRKVLQAHPPSITLLTVRNTRGSGRMPLKRYIPQFAAELWADKYNHKRKKNRAELGRIQMMAASPGPSFSDDEGE